jgi:hypothetical protein
MNATTIIAGFYCSPEEKAAYADDKIIIRGIYITIFAGLAYLIINKVKKQWLRALLLVLLAVASLVGAAITEIMVIGFDCS